MKKLILGVLLLIGINLSASSFAANKKACDNDNPIACYNLGSIYNNGLKGVKKNKLKAVKFYNKSCNAGFAGACSNLGTIYQYGGNGIKSNYMKARQLFEKACNSNKDPVPCYNLGNLYLDGKGVAQNKATAKEWYKKACKGGLQRSCKKLEKMNFKDHRSVSVAYKKSCNKKKDSHACYSLGSLYEQGQGVGKSSTMALVYYRKACDGDNSLGCSAYKKLSKTLKKKKLNRQASERKRKAKTSQVNYNNMKNNVYRGACVYMDGKMGVFKLKLKIKGFVEDIGGNDSIQIRISGTDGGTPTYKGVKLYPNTIIWDNKYNWTLCN